MNISGQFEADDGGRSDLDHADDLRARRGGHLHFPSLLEVPGSNPDPGRRSGSHRQRLLQGPGDVRQLAEQESEGLPAIRAPLQSGDQSDELEAVLTKPLDTLKLFKTDLKLLTLAQCSLEPPSLEEVHPF